jgi:hypothetical protein
VKRFIALAIVALLAITPSAQAVPKKITVNSLKLLTTIGLPSEVSGVVISGKNFIVYGTQNSRAYAKALDVNGTQLWSTQLDQSQGSVATAAAVDTAGDIWIAGSTPLAAATAVAPSGTTQATINPDNAAIPAPTLVGDLKALTIWKVSATGVIGSPNVLPSSHVILPTAVLIDKAGLTIVGSLASEKTNAGFIVSLNFSGIFSKLVQIGSISTTIESVSRNTDGTFTLVGSSGETIAGKKLAGLIDGVIVRVSKDLKIVSAVRSSINKGRRIWNTTTGSLLLGGEVVVGNKSEIAVTKFSPRYLPTWTFRFAGTGPGFTIGSTQLFFLSSAAVPQLLWNPKVPTPLLITFNSKGAISAADSAPIGQRLLIGSLESKELGPLVVTSSVDTVSIFIRNTR